ncbi:MAG: MBL fold metallo-hydrolase, partial [Thermoanaerobaculia bacterium]
MRFRNLRGSLPQTAGLAEFVPFFLRRARDLRPPPVPPGHVMPTAEAKALLARTGPESLTWLGHATFLLRTGGKTILTDPFLSDRASPFAGLGPKRYVPPGLPFEALPKIDAIVISHNHYDHLDARAIERFSSKEKIAALVPSGLGDFFLRRGYRDVRELRWEESARLGGVVFTALPCIHFSGRTPFDRNATLWCSWSIVSPSLRVFFAGDTGYGPVFAETGARHGPFDLALVP